ncbi:MAG: ABC transporter permease [Hyphomicrobiales bacterium]|nr:ABC transporter permease [Hyphomicrobiales bacterium]
MIEKRRVALVQRDSISGRALVTVVAIMTFLATLSAGAAFLVAQASDGWQHQVSQEMTIQVRPAEGRSLDKDAAAAAALARATRGIASVRIVSKAESERLLQPWLGSGLNFDALPIPRMIIVKLGNGAPPDLQALNAALAKAVPNAALDDHRLWLQRLDTMAGTMETGAVLVFMLVLVATALAVGFATRGAMAGNRDIIDVLHFVGASDGYIAREFQGHFLRLGATGAASGALLAVLIYAAAGLFEHFAMATAGGDQLRALFGSFSIGSRGYGVIAMIALGIALLTAFMSRSVVIRHLRGLY